MFVLILSTSSCPVLSSVASSVYVLGTIKSHGLTGKGLQKVTKATTIAQIMYALPAWWGFTRMKDRDKTDRLVHRMRRQGFLSSEGTDATQLVIEADSKLFNAICNSTLNTY